MVGLTSHEGLLNAAVTSTYTFVCWASALIGVGRDCTTLLSDADSHTLSNFLVTAIITVAQV